MSVTPVKLSITKSVTFRGQTEEFSNVYTIYGLDKDSESARDQLIDNAEAAEKAVHAAVVTFVRAQIYSFGDVGPNFMYETRNLTGTGSATTGTNMFRECVILFRAKMERSFSLSRSSQPYLRKFIHSCSALTGDAVGANAPGFFTPGSAPLTTYIAFLNDPGTGLALTNDDGDEPIGPWQVANTLYHRQFRRGRKEY